MSKAVEQSNRLLLRARDTMDRDYAKPLDVAGLARVALMSEAHFIREFGTAFGEPPNRYLQRRRVERAMFLLTQTDLPIMDVCLDVGFTSLGTCGRAFRDIVGKTPTQFRQGNSPHEELSAKGVEFTQEPTEHFYGIDCGIRDPFGNNLRFSQPNPNMKVPSPEELKKEFFVSE